MSELNDILTAISTVGFPIVMCIWLNYSNNKKLDNLTQALNKNTQVLSLLMDRLGVDKNE